MDALWMLSGACVVYSVEQGLDVCLFLVISKDDDEVIKYLKKRMTFPPLSCTLRLVLISKCTSPKVRCIFQTHSVTSLLVTTLQSNTG